MRINKSFEFIPEDSKVLEVLLDSKGRINSNIIRDINNEKYSKLKKFLDNRYNDIPSNKFSYSEVVYRIKNNIETRPVCEVCGKPVSFIKMNKGFSKCCSKECADISPKRIERTKETCTKKYGNTCVFNSPVYIEKIKKTNIEKYGVDNPWKSEKIKSKIVENREKGTGYKYPLQNPEILDKVKQHNIEKYGVPLFSKSESFKKLYNNEEFVEQFKKKQYNTFKKNSSFNKSREEEILKELILEKYPDMTYQHTDSLYPFRCDFYIPSLKLYIEYNGSMFHHYKRFEGTKEDLKELDNVKRKIEENKSKKLSRYTNVIKVWTIDDPKKIETAIKNKINYLAIYPKWELHLRKYVNDKNKKQEDLEEVRKTLYNLIEIFREKTNIQIFVGEK